MAQTTVVLVHAPLVGPSTWSGVAEELRARSIDVVVPTLPVESGALAIFDHCVSAVAAQISSDDIVLVGHSGSGALLPFIGRQAGASKLRYVLVDANLPPASGSLVLAEPWFRQMLEQRAEDGILPRWSTWWGDEVLEWMLPDPEIRAVVCADVPHLPMSYFDAVPIVPDGWSDRGGGYVLLSESYRVWSERAAEHGWPVVELLGMHLDIVNRPHEIAAAIVAVAGLE